MAALARQSGLDIQGTRSEQAISIASQMDISCETLLALGAQADYAAFSGNTVNEEHVQQYWHDIAQERKYMLKSLPTLRRWRAKLSLADVSIFEANTVAAYDNPQVAAEMLVQSALDAGGNDNVTAIVLDLRDDSANNAADTATNTTVDIDWNVSKIGDYEDIGDLQEGTLQTLRTIQ